MTADNDSVIRKVRELGLRAAPDALRAFLTHATKTRLSPTQVCEQLAELERREREGRNRSKRLQQAALGTFRTVDQFDWAHPRRIDRDLYEQLSTLAFIPKGENVLLRGPSGVGKTTLAQNLGLRAVETGYCVRFSTLASALADLLKQESVPALERRMRRYTTPALLILDEIGFVPCDNHAADLFYNIVSRRHERRSLILTTNLPFKQWGSVFPGAACVGALIDRFVEHCYVIDIEADSWRQKHSRARSSES